ncbi:repressor splicing factor 1 [Cotesia typhae]|uniref:repressor splicing factor 1 n=1 Tax=Cotesia typhae TaxID=2053667 RepID=UPI003D684FE6
MTPEGYTRVYVGGLTETIKKEDLQTEFEKFGKLNKVWVAFNPPGFAFIEFLRVDEAELACNSMNGTEILGTKLRVEISRGPGRSRNRGGGGGGGGGGFRGQSGGGRGGFGGSRRSYGGGGAGGGYHRDNNSYGNQGGNSNSYHSGRAGGGGPKYSSRGRYGGDNNYSGGRNNSGYMAGGNSYSQGYNNSSGNGDASVDYYNRRNKDSSGASSRYRNRSPAGRGSHRHLRECT